MLPTFYIIATPIGNLEDLSSRAARLLAIVPIIVVESYKRTRKLLTYLGIKDKHIISYQKYNRQQAARNILKYLDNGLSIALVTDSGTPGISDPGALIVNTITSAGYKVSPIPGPSALTASLSVAGMKNANPVIFLGFLPNNPKARHQFLKKAITTDWPFVLYESPHRLAKTAQDLLLLAGDRPLILTRELSKINETIEYTTCARLVKNTYGKKIKGEITIIVTA